MVNPQQAVYLKGNDLNRLPLGEAHQKLCTLLDDTTQSDEVVMQIFSRLSEDRRTQLFKYDQEGLEEDGKLVKRLNKYEHLMEPFYQKEHDFKEEEQFLESKAIDKITSGLADAVHSPAQQRWVMQYLGHCKTHYRKLFFHHHRVKNMKFLQDSLLGTKNLGERAEILLRHGVPHLRLDEIEELKFFLHLDEEIMKICDRLGSERVPIEHSFDECLNFLSHADEEEPTFAYLTLYRRSHREALAMIEEAKEADEKLAMDQFHHHIGLISQGILKRSQANPKFGEYAAEHFKMKIEASKGPVSKVAEMEQRLQKIDPEKRYQDLWEGYFAGVKDEVEKIYLKLTYWGIRNDDLFTEPLCLGPPKTTKEEKAEVEFSQFIRTGLRRAMIQQMETREEFEQFWTIWKQLPYTHHH